MARKLVGTVSSDKADKTIVVTVRTRKTHPIYRKQYTVTKKFIAHDEANEARVGDHVSIVETRPISARKRHSLERVIERAGVAFTDTESPLEATETDKEAEK